ncbi:hypothetical protein, partial [Kitasatospora aureofaciens]
LTAPLLALYAEHSRAHDPHRTAAATRHTLPHATVTTIPGASHHTLPMAAAPEVNHHLLNFLPPPHP